MGKLCWEVRERRYDIVVVDAVASGHIIGHLAAPQAINRLVQVGLIRQQTDWMLEILSDPKISGVLAVTTPEEMPVSETIELIGRLGHRDDGRLAGVVVNRVLPELFGTREEQVFEAISGPQVSEQLACCSRRPSRALARGGPPHGKDAAVSRRSPGPPERSGGKRAHRAPDAGLFYVPFMFLRSYGLRSTRQVAAALAAELNI